MLYPFTEILNPGPISNGRLENRARLAICFELTFEIREFNKDMPSFPVEGFMAVELRTGASGSVGSR